MRSPSRSPWWRAGLLLPAALAAGCVTSRSQLEQALLADRNPAAHNADLEALYLVRCPDVLDLRVEGLPDWSGPHPVGPDGCVGLPGGKRLRVDGLPAPAVARALARAAGVPAGRASARVAEYNSQHLYLFGEVNGIQRVVPYRGPETILDLLQRAGGLAPGAALGQIRVVRPHVADGRPPEVFTVDLQAILLKHDQDTNVPLQPSDHVYVGESGKSRLAPCFPPWLRPLYEALSGMKRAK